MPARATKCWCSVLRAAARSCGGPSNGAGLWRQAQNGVAVDVAQLRTLAEQIKSEAAKPTVRSQQTGDSKLEPEVQRSVSVPRVSSITFDARLANWDGDVETDGLLIDVLPLDRDQAAIPVSGTVEIELFAPPRRLSHDTPHAGEDTVVLVERWTRTIRPADFGASGARLRLPFGAVHPEFDTDLLAYGLVHVRLVAPGHGVFDDSRDAVRIRPWAPNRDQMEMNTGRRFLSTEGVGRN